MSFFSSNSSLAKQRNWDSTEHFSCSFCLLCLARVSSRSALLLFTPSAAGVDDTGGAEPDEDANEREVSSESDSSVAKGKTSFALLLSFFL